MCPGPGKLAQNGLKHASIMTSPTKNSNPKLPNFVKSKPQDLSLIFDIKKPSRMSSLKNFNQLWQGIKELKETMLIQNKKLDKLTNLENKLNGIQQKMVEYENKLNQLEEEKEQLRDKMVQKTNLLVLQLDRQEQYIRRKNILIYGVEENKEDNDDGKKVLFKIADELEIDLEDNEVQRVHRLGQKRRNNVNPRPIIARFVSYKQRNEFLTNKRELKNIEDSMSSFVKISHLYDTSY